jgi:hypothetical protein
MPRFEKAMLSVVILLLKSKTTDATAIKVKRAPTLS